MHGGSEIVKKHFEEKIGYVNYFYNRREQERLWNAWNGRSRLDNTRDAWLLTGESAGGGSVNSCGT